MITVRIGNTAEALNTTGNIIGDGVGEFFASRDYHNGVRCVAQGVEVLVVENKQMTSHGGFELYGAVKVLGELIIL